MATRTGYPGTEVAGDILTASNFNKLPGGLIGYAVITSSVTGITTATDITGLSVTLTPGGNRMIRVQWHTEDQITTTSTNDSFAVTCMKDGAVIAAAIAYVTPVTNQYVSNDGFVLDVGPSSASHTYKLQGGRQQGTGTWAVRASATEQNTIAIFDDGISF